MTVNDADTARLLVTCPDKPGIISAVSTFLYNHGANITDFDQHSSDAHGGTFFLLTGFHGLHVTIGTLILIVMLVRVIRGHFSSERHFAFEAAAWYWHFVDAVWIGLFLFVYVF